MKRLFVLSGLASLICFDAARAEVQDCIEIVALPAVITQTGVHCLKQDLSTSATSGNAITINANSVVIEMNGFKLGGLGGGAATNANGIFAQDRLNITIRNGSIRGFFNNIFLSATGDKSSSAGHVVEDMRIESARLAGVRIDGFNSIIRDNFVLNTGNRTVLSPASGIHVNGGSGHSITGNVISGVTEEGDVTGIFASNTSAAIIRGNEIRAVTGGNNIGIRLTSGNRTIIQNNLIANSAGGTTGILAAAGVDACIGNTVTGFTTAFSGCFFVSGNQSF